MYKSRAGKVAQVVKCLPSKHEALSSNPVQQKKKKKKKKKLGCLGVSNRLMTRL
jgi:hypothetical protein